MREPLPVVVVVDLPGTLYEDVTVTNHSPVLQSADLSVSQRGNQLLALALSSLLIGLLESVPNVSPRARVNLGEVDLETEPVRAEPKSDGNPDKTVTHGGRHLMRRYVASRGFQLFR